MRTLATVGAAIVMSFTAGSWSTPRQIAAQALCTPGGATVRLAGLPEASGLTASRTAPGRLWAHNDSGRPEVFGLDANGAVTDRVTLLGATVEDWEAIASAPCGNGSCLYVADIGDNSASRSHITVYRVPEPASGAGSVKVDGIFRASYPDGAHDAETLLAAPDGALYFVTKGETGPVALYRFPRDLRADTMLRLERVGNPLSANKPAGDARVTDGAVSADGGTPAGTFASLTCAL